MAYKKIDKYFSFADIAIQNNADKNRSLIFLNKINSTIDWYPVQEMLIKFYPLGKSNEGERPYSPLLLFKRALHNHPNSFWFVRPRPQIVDNFLSYFLQNLHYLFDFIEYLCYYCLNKHFKEATWLTKKSITIFPLLTLLFKIMLIKTVP